MSFRFFLRGKFCGHSDEEVERIAALPSVEDKTRTFPHWTIYIAWACKSDVDRIEKRRFVRLVVILSVATCAFFIILYSLEWGAKRANEWLMTMMLSFGQSILVIDPLKVFLITAAISFLIRRPYDDETLDYNDPFTATLVSNQTVADLEGHDLYDNKKIKGKSFSPQDR